MNTVYVVETVYLYVYCVIIKSRNFLLDRNPLDKMYTVPDVPSTKLNVTLKRRFGIGFNVFY